MDYAEDTGCELALSKTHEENSPNSMEKQSSVFYARVKTFLGHKTLDSTLVYINIENSIYGTLRDEAFTVRVTKEPDEITKLLEAGFEYVCQRDQLMFFRKRK